MLRQRCSIPNGIRTKNYPSWFTFSEIRLVTSRNLEKVARFIAHVQSHCTDDHAFCLSTFLLPLPSYFALAPCCIIQVKLRTVVQASVCLERETMRL